MNINIPGLARAAVPEADERNARIISDNRGPSHRDPGFLSQDFPHSPPKLYFTAESGEFDALTLAEWKAEGFDVGYIPMGDGGDKYRHRLQALSKQRMGPCETFGIIAYGDAASLCLEHYHVMDNNPDFKLGLLIAYYPTTIPDPQGRFPSSITALVHLPAGQDVGVVKQSQMVGIQGKKRVRRQKIENGLSLGRTLHLAYPSYAYEAGPGFAEHDLDEFDRVCADLAWSRSLAAARRAFAREVDLEAAVEENVQSKFFTRSLQPTMSTYTTHKSPHVTYIPTLTGGIGSAELERFYSEFFSNPPSTKLTLLSRTIGADRVVDEIHVRFRHTQEMSWILPGVPATNRWVEVLVVSIVTLRGGKLYHEHVYWDQASVLVQVGLLDPRLVPESARRMGFGGRLPVVGREAARRVWKGWDPEEEGEADNGFIPGWGDDYDDDDNDDDDGGDENVAADEGEKSEKNKGGKNDAGRKRAGEGQKGVTEEQEGNDKLKASTDAKGKQPAEAAD